MVSHFHCIGRLTANPQIETRSGKDGQQLTVANFNVAVDDPYGDTDFYRCVAWNKTAENIGKYLGKGRLVYIEGRVKVKNYETQNGEKRTSWEVLVNNVRFLDKSPNENGQQQMPNPQYNQQPAGFPQQPQYPQNPNGFPQYGQPFGGQQPQMNQQPPQMQQSQQMGQQPVRQPFYNNSGVPF